MASPPPISSPVRLPTPRGQIHRPPAWLPSCPSPAAPGLGGSSSKPSRQHAEPLTSLSGHSQWPARSNGLWLPHLHWEFLPLLWGLHRHLPGEPFSVSPPRYIPSLPTDLQCHQPSRNPPRPPVLYLHVTHFTESCSSGCAHHMPGPCFISSYPWSPSTRPCARGEAARTGEWLAPAGTASQRQSWDSNPGWPRVKSRTHPVGQAASFQCLALQRSGPESNFAPQTAGAGGRGPHCITAVPPFPPPTPHLVLTEEG